MGDKFTTTRSPADRFAERFGPKPPRETFDVNVHTGPRPRWSPHLEETSAQRRGRLTQRFLDLYYQTLDIALGTGAPGISSLHGALGVILYTADKIAFPFIWTAAKVVGSMASSSAAIQRKLHGPPPPQKVTRWSPTPGDGELSHGIAARVADHEADQGPRSDIYQARYPESSLGDNATKVHLDAVEQSVSEWARGWPKIANSDRPVDIAIAQGRALNTYIPQAAKDHLLGGWGPTARDDQFVNAAVLKLIEPAGEAKDQIVEAFRKPDGKIELVFKNPASAARFAVARAILLQSPRGPKLDSGTHLFSDVTSEDRSLLTEQSRKWLMEAEKQLEGVDTAKLLAGSRDMAAKKTAEHEKVAADVDFGAVFADL